MTSRTAALTALPWQRSLAWLAFLAPFFFLSYGYANRLAAARHVTDSLYFSWEPHIPFLPWTIVPYWSIDLLYGLSFLLCRDRREVDIHGLRLLSAQLISVACFLAFPLRFAFDRPATDGLFGALFDLLMGFDQPFNQAPSLHISLLVILWARFAAAMPARFLPLVHFWAVLIGVSVLTTYQHHFIDLPTGLAAGLLCLWLWPDSGPAVIRQGAVPTPRHFSLASRYLLAAVLCLLPVAILGGAAFWLGWPALALAMVAAIYAFAGPDGFQKHRGRHSLAVRWLLAPYIAAARLNARWWTHARPTPDLIGDGVWLGRLPTSAEMKHAGLASLCDLTAELPAPAGSWHYVNLPWLDLVPPAPQQLVLAAQQIEHLRNRGSVLVCCALGYSRSAAAVSAWLLLTRRASDVEAAVAQVAACRPGVVLGSAHRAALADAVALMERGET
jgi:protein-tyrosine phosphatase